MDYDIEIYTDGACSGNPGIGGWGVIIYTKINTAEIKTEELFGGSENTTNNRMEMQAIIQSLQKIKNEQDKKIVIYTDSKYIQQGITTWIKQWKKNKWHTSAKKPVKNKDLWVLIDNMITLLNIEWVWVKGHSTNKGNILADQLANKGKALYNKNTLSN